VTGFEWVHTSEGVAAFRHGDVEVWLNTGSTPVALPRGEVLLASMPGTQPGFIAPASAAWLRRS
jgi:alpha-glucosidase